MFRTHTCAPVLLLAAYLCALNGCKQSEPIVRYKVPTKVPDQLAPGKERMLAAMFPKGQVAWFIKVRGPEESIAEVESEFRTFVESIAFKKSNPDLSSLPDKWRRGGEKAMRFASIDVETSSKQLDISISKLPLREDWDGYVADNVNRWRGQLGLDRSNKKWADGTELTIASADTAGVWVDIVGDPSSADTSMSPPFASQAMAPPPSEEPKPEFNYKRPEGWREGRMSSMRLAAFNVGEVDLEAEVTVITAGGGLRENVARWLGQVRGGETPKEVVDKAMEDAQKIKISGHDAQRFLLTGDDDENGTAIDATIVPLEEGFSMFIKMTGPIATVTANADALTTFLESLEF